MILNPKVVSSSRTVSPPHGELDLPGFLSKLVPTSTSSSSSLIATSIEDHVHGIVSHVSQRLVILRLVKRIFLNNSIRCYFAFVISILEYFSLV